MLISSRRGQVTAKVFVKRTHFPRLLRPLRPLADVAKGGDGAKSAPREASCFYALLNCA